MKHNKQKTLLLYLYITLWVLNKLQGLFIDSSILSILLYLPFTFITLVCSYKVILNLPKTRTLQVLSVFFVIILLYGIELLLFNDAYGQSRTSFLIATIGSIGPIFAFYYFAYHGVVTPKRLFYSFIIFLCVALFEFYSYQAAALIQLANDFDDITNNAAYAVLGCFPFLFLMNRKLIFQFVGLAIICFHVISGLKRGAVLILFVLLLWFFINAFNSTSSKKKIYLILLSLSLIFVGANYIQDFYNESEYFQYRVEMTKEGSSSSRDMIYSTLWSHFKTNDNLIEVLFGEGAYHTENVSRGLKAHNDWLELLIDCGLFGVFFYVLYWMAFWRDFKRSKSYSVALYSILGCCFLYTFLRTLFSMSFTDIPFYISLMIGYGFAALYYPNILEDENTCIR